MAHVVKAPNTKRFVVEDSITKVTSDGEPHGTMTMIAGLSGLCAAVVILTILVSIVGCKKRRRAQHCKDCPSSNDNTLKLQCRAICNDSVGKRSSMASNTTRATSIGEHNYDSLARVASTGVITIPSGNLEGNLNAAFVDSELCLTTDGMQKKKKRAHWSDELVDKDKPRDTVIDVERY